MKTTYNEAMDQERRTLEYTEYRLSDNFGHPIHTATGPYDPTLALYDQVQVEANGEVIDMRITNLCTGDQSHWMALDEATYQRIFRVAEAQDD